MKKVVQFMKDHEFDKSESRGHCVSSVIQAYEIKVEGHLDHYWSDWFNGWEIRYQEDSTTSLIGTVVDQAELYGHIDQLRDLNLPLIFAKRVDPEIIKMKADK